MLTITAKTPDGRVASLDDHGTTRLTSMTIFNMCKRVGFPVFSGKYHKMITDLTQNKVSALDYLNELLEELHASKG